MTPQRRASFLVYLSSVQCIVRRGDVNRNLKTGKCENEIHFPNVVPLTPKKLGGAFAEEMS